MNKKPPLPLSAFLGPQTGNDLNVGNIGNTGSINTVGGNIGGNNNGGGGGGVGSSSGGGGGGGGGNNGSSMCFPTTPKNEKQRDNHGSGLCGCQKAPKSHCISATGVLLLVLLYTAMGSIIFVTLEGELEDMSSLETAVAASKPYPRTELANAEIRSRTVDRLWSITEDLNILYKENWTRLAAQEVQLFQDTLLRAVRQSKIYQPGVHAMNTPTHKWTYASAFLYSLTLITTIGYGGISPRTQWGRVAALLYALFGIPIVLLYLSAMGEALSAGMRCLFRRTRAKGSVTNGSGGANGGGNAGGVGKKNASGKNDGGAGKGSGNKQHYSAHHHGNKMHQYGMPSTVYQQSNAAASGSPAGRGGGGGGGGAGGGGNGSGRNTSNRNSVPISVCVMVLVCYVTSGAILFHKLQSWSVLESLYFCFTSLGTIGFGELAPTGTLTLYTASAYILVGMAVVAMCFSLIQTEIVMWLRKFSVQDHVTPKAEEVALVSVAVTPKSS